MELNLNLRNKEKPKYIWGNDITLTQQILTALYNIRKQNG